MGHQCRGYANRITRMMMVTSLLAAMLPGGRLVATEVEQSKRMQNSTTMEIPLTSGWHITQDVRQLGEQVGWYRPDFIPDWQPIERLAHLQLLLAAQPYFGRSLRYFNDSPWWYRLEFPTPESYNKVTLRFEGVDYFSKIWLNGTLVGEHEGYADPFGFEVTNLLQKGRQNVLAVKVWSPWDHQYKEPSWPTYSVVRNLLKGSYEHADTFVQRDVNPVGIWRPVKLLLHNELREDAQPTVGTTISGDQKKATINIDWSIVNEASLLKGNFVVRLRLKTTGVPIAETARSVTLVPGSNSIRVSLDIPFPKLWTTWDRGSQPLYEAKLEFGAPHDTRLDSLATFGIRSVELRRSSEETRFFVNGKPLYLRGASYWPDLYLSNMSTDRYRRDIQAAIRAGINAFRVHVHTENPEFYELCDQYGIVIIQDNDLNWVFPADADFAARAARGFGNMISLLKNHPSIIAWIAMNEVGLPSEAAFGGLINVGSDAIRQVGSRLIATAHELDPTRPTIENSQAKDDLASGDAHDYRGSLSGGRSTYFDIFGSKDKLVTEFGVDAPPALSSLRAIPEAVRRLREVLPRVSELHDYQYALLKYYIEHYRIQKYSPNAGYFQFMWIDFSPQSFYGIYDYWGLAKSDGIGGGLRALQESNQPIGIFMEHRDEPVALYAVNDSSADLGECIARWRVSTSTSVVEEGSQTLQLGADDHRKVRDFGFPVKKTESYKVVLDLLSSKGEVLAHNVYLNPFTPLPRPQGYPERMDEELGMRLWWAGMKSD